MDIEILELKGETLLRKFNNLKFIPSVGSEMVISQEQYEVKHVRYDLDRYKIKIYVELF